jgi:hypothetical protein
MAETKMTIVGDRRFITDRRINSQPFNSNRRFRPDRRLNNLLVEWIPSNEVVLHPHLFKAYMRSNTKK